MIIFRRMRGRIVKLNVDELKLAGTRHTARVFEGMKEAVRKFKEFRVNQFARAKMYRPGGALDPVEQAKLVRSKQEHALLDLREKIKSKHAPTEFGQAMAKVEADSAVSKIMAAFNKMRRPDYDAPRHFTRQEVAKLAGKPPTKAAFLEHAKETVGGAKAAGYEEVLGKKGLGAKGIAKFEGFRRRAGKQVYAEIKPQLGKASLSDRLINARAKGATFVKENGKIKVKRGKP